MKFDRKTQEHHRRWCHHTRLLWEALTHLTIVYPVSSSKSLPSDGRSPLPWCQAGLNKKMEIVNWNKAAEERDEWRKRTEEAWGMKGRRWCIELELFLLTSLSLPFFPAPSSSFTFLLSFPVFYFLLFIPSSPPVLLSSRSLSFLSLFSCSIIFISFHFFPLSSLSVPFLPFSPCP